MFNPKDTKTILNSFNSIKQQIESLTNDYSKLAKLGDTLSKSGKDRLPTRKH